MASEIKCPQIDGIYCLDYFWNHKAMPEVCRKILSKELAHAYEIFSQGSSDNSILVHEKKRGVVSMCPGHHHGQLGNLRLVMIVDPRKTSKGLVSLFFPCYHNREYSAMLNGAQSVYDGFREITFANKQELDRFEKNVVPSLRPLVVVGFYKIIFKESEDKDKILQAYDDVVKERAKQNNTKNTSAKQLENTYNAAIEMFYYWYEVVTKEKEYTPEEVYEQLFQDFTKDYGVDWEKDIKTILEHNAKIPALKFWLDQLKVWEIKKSKTVCPVLPSEHEY